ncbi:MAG: polyprenyl synthetase family protein [Parcubacteria group bacterium]|nr:polyprenyl synthetase family protein [Parcubacteria group bacterium]
MVKGGYFALVRQIQAEVDPLLTSFLEGEFAWAKKIHPRAGELFQEIKRSLKDGKRNRPTLLAIGYLAGGGRDISAILPAAAAIEIFHMYALIHDDIMDRAPLRRFKPTSVAFFGNKFKSYHLGMSAAILAGDLAENMADVLFLKCRLKPRLLLKGLDIFGKLKEEVCLGQYLDIQLQKSKTAGSKEANIILTYKTAKYSFERPLHIGAALAGAAPKIFAALSKYALPVGAAFQIQDDILGVFGSEAEIGKSTDSDIREGKLTMLKMEALKRAGPADKKTLLRVLGNPRAKKSEIAAVRDIFVRTGAHDYAKKQSLTLARQAKKSLSGSILTQRAATLLSSFADFILERPL